MLLCGCQAPDGTGRDALNPVVTAQASNLAQAKRFHRQAGQSARRSPEQALASYLTAAELALGGLDSKDAGSRNASHEIYNECCEQVSRLVLGQGGDWKEPIRTETTGGIGYALTIATSGQGLLDPRLFDSTDKAKSVKAGRLGQRQVTQGIGGAMVGYREWTEERGKVDPFMPRMGRAIPFTATLEFPAPGKGALLRFHDTEVVADARIAGARRPLQADFTAPLTKFLQHSPKENIAWQGLTDPDDYVGSVGLFQVERFRSDRIPVVFVHGLNSRPKVWVNAYHKLRGDPVIRRHYQFLFYRYPTGYPIGYNAYGLRSELARFRKHHNPGGSNPKMREMVLIGHSMGGILSNAQVRKGGEQVRRKLFEHPLNQLDLASEAEATIRKITDFEPNPDVRRVIFVATPHRGSAIAGNQIGRLGSRLIRFPFKLVSGGVSIATEGITETAREFLDQRTDSIYDLQPNSATLTTILELPMSPRVDIHSIIGDRGFGNSPDSSDGVVPYWSSHLDGAESEKIVPYDHGAPRYPEAIKEIGRILYLHADQPWRPGTLDTTEKRKPVKHRALHKLPR